MKPKWIVAAALLVLAVCLYATETAGRTTFSRWYDDTVLLTDTPTDYTTSTIYLENLVLTNYSAGTTTCTIQDRASVPKILYNQSVPPGLMIMNFGAVVMESGVTWSCTSSSAVVVRVRAKR